MDLLSYSYFMSLNKSYPKIVSKPVVNLMRFMRLTFPWAFFWEEQYVRVGPCVRIAPAQSNTKCDVRLCWNVKCVPCSWNELANGQVAQDVQSTFTLPCSRHKENLEIAIQVQLLCKPDGGLQLLNVSCFAKFQVRTAVFVGGSGLHVHRW